jgi:asparagine synthase (glutamine-hydrolysing)
MVEFAAQVPAKSKIRRFNGKHLVKRAMRQILPNAIIDRKKMGFPVPIKQWFRGNSARSVRSVLLSEKTKEHGIFNTEYLARQLDEHVQGARDNTDALWTVLNFELWTRVFIDGQSCASVSDELVESIQPSRQACLAGVT